MLLSQRRICQSKQFLEQLRGSCAVFCACVYQTHSSERMSWNESVVYWFLASESSCTPLSPLIHISNCCSTSSLHATAIGTPAECRAAETSMKMRSQRQKKRDSTKQTTLSGRREMDVVCKVYRLGNTDHLEKVCDPSCPALKHSRDKQCLHGIHSISNLNEYYCKSLVLMINSIAKHSGLLYLMKFFLFFFILQLPNYKVCK